MKKKRNLEKELKELQKKYKKKAKEKELKKKITQLKYRKYLLAGEKVRTGISRLGAGSKKVWQKMKEMEEKEARRNKGRPAPPKMNFDEIFS